MIVSAKVSSVPIVCAVCANTYPFPKYSVALDHQSAQSLLRSICYSRPAEASRKLQRDSRYRVIASMMQDVCVCLYILISSAMTIES